MIRNVTERAFRLAITERDVIMMYLPLFHLFAFSEGMLMSMVSGARQVLTEGFDPAESLDLMARERTTVLHGFDTHYKELIEAQERDPRHIGRIRTGIAAAGMQSSTAIARRAREVFGPLVSGFGMSEIGVGVAIGALDSTEEQCCEASGFPAPGYEVRIVDPATGRDQPVEVPGEILARGYTLMRGYYEKPEATAAAIDADGWLHTGDMGLLRADGHLRFMGRYKDMLKIGGENVDPMEVEAFLMAHPAVNLAAVVSPPRRAAERGGRGVRALGAGPSPHRGRRARPLPRPHRELQDPPSRHLRRRFPDDQLGQDPEGEAPRGSRSSSRAVLTALFANGSHARRTGDTAGAGGVGSSDHRRLRTGHPSSRSHSFAAVAIVEGPRGRAAHAPPRIVGGQAALLHGHRRHAGKRRSGLMGERAEISDHEDIGMAGHREIRLDRHAAGAVQRDAEGSGERRRLDPRRPEHGAAADLIAADPHGVGRDVRDRRAGAHLDAAARERRRRLRRERVGEGGQDARTALEENDPGLARVDDAEVARHALPGDLGKRPGQLHARGAAADHHEGEQGAALRPVQASLGGFVGQQHAPPDLECVFQRLETGGEQLPVVRGRSRSGLRRWRG
jgi:hypothetical protein